MINVVFIGGPLDGQIKPVANDMAYYDVPMYSGINTEWKDECETVANFPPISIFRYEIMNSASKEYWIAVPLNTPTHGIMTQLIERYVQSKQLKSHVENFCKNSIKPKQPKKAIKHNNNLKRTVTI